MRIGSNFDYSLFDIGSIAAPTSPGSSSCASANIVERIPTCTNVLNVSMIPWVHFTAFNLNLQHGDQYLLPIFTLGKYQEKDGRRMLPLAIQVHHAVCDGYHIALFMEKLQQKTAAFPAGTPGCKRKNS